MAERVLKKDFFPLHLIGILSFLTLISCLMVACASSGVQRDAASNIDLGVQNAKNLAQSATNGDMADTYQNTSQSTKGAMMGGAAGAVTGAMSGAIGFVPGVAAGAILGATYGRYIDANTTLADKLDNRGANVVVLGDQVLIVIPSSRIFNSMSASIKPTAYSTLDLVAEYINSYTKMLVKISTYTNDLGSKRVNLALSDQQAQALAKYFTAKGVDARVLYATGYGGTHLVDKISLDWDKSDNYRIEISLEKLKA